MVNNPKVHIIPPVPPKRDKRVGIYCRVSTNSSEQLKKSHGASITFDKNNCFNATVAACGCLHGYCDK